MNLNQVAIREDGQYPLLRCRVCGIGPLHRDQNPKPRHWAGVVTWGANQYDGEISEVSIDSYRLYVINERLQKLGPPQAVLEAKVWANLFNTTHCNNEYYKAHVDFILHPDAFSFMVVPLTRGGLELNIGTISDRIVDVSRQSSSIAAQYLSSPSVLTLQLILTSTCLLQYKR